ncbi:MAG: hypothetical protein JSS19_02090 [Proteobacteria bacterium]|nr:hypothetical protein [Pseudomonadota bacterium]
MVISQRQYLDIGRSADFSSAGLAVNLNPAVGCAHQYRAGRARQNARTQRTPVSKDEQRRMARPARYWWVHSVVTQQVNATEAKKIKAHKALLKVASG